MAYSEEKWNKAKGYYEAGLSLSQINDKTGIDRSAISRKAKKQQWQHGKNADYIVSKEIIATKKTTESNTSLICADEVADELIRNKNLVFGVTQKALAKASKMIDELDNAQDLKHIVDLSDKASLTLGVNQRHAKTEINNTNAQQTVSEIVIREA